jgi:hypothetical protein
MVDTTTLMMLYVMWAVGCGLIGLLTFFWLLDVLAEN